MLITLDGESGKLSPRYIKRAVKRAREIKVEFEKYIPHYFRFLGIIETITDNDPELRKEYDELLKHRHEARQNYEKRIEEEYLNKKGLTPNHQHNFNSNKNNCNLPETGTKGNDDVIMDNGILEVGNELIRICHSTKEGKIHCGPFH